MKKKGRGGKAAAATLDVNAFRPEPKTALIGEERFAFQTFDFGNFEKFHELKKAIKDAGDDDAKQAAAALAVYGFILPEAPAALLKKLAPEQLEVISAFWLGEAVKELDEQEEDAKDVLTDPTPPA